MNVPEDLMKKWGYPQLFANHERILKMIFGSSEYMCSFDTYQFKDYSKVVAPRFDPVKKAQRRKEIFPVDCDRAFDLGARFATTGK